MSPKFYSHMKSQITQIKEDGLYKDERVIISPQMSKISIDSGEHVINFCANNLRNWPFFYFNWRLLFFLTHLTLDESRLFN